MSLKRCVVTLGCLAGPVVFSACADPVPVSRDWPAAGGTATAAVVTVSRRAGEEALDEIQRKIEEVLERVDPDRADSRLGELNRKAVEAPFLVSDQDLYRAILLGLDYARVTEGAFDPTAGALRRLYLDVNAPDAAAIDEALAHVGYSRLTVMEEARAVRLAPGVELALGGLGHGMALDVAKRVFSRPGIRSGMLRVGDVYYAWNAMPRRPPWALELDHPATGEPLLELEMANRALAVSATGRPVRGGAPLLDPRTGRPPHSDVRLAIAVADSASDAAVLSQALLVAGSRRSGGLLSRTRRVEAILLVEDDAGPSLLVSGSLRERMRLGDELSAKVGQRIRFLLPPAAL